MRAAAIADVHLGYRGPGRTVAGRSIRELDVEAAWHRAVENILHAGVDLVTIAGDVFDNPRVSHHAVRAYRDGVRALTSGGIHVVVAQGNHDAARTAATLSPIWIPEDYERLYIAAEPARIPITVDRTGELASVAVFPFVALGTGEAYRVEPDASADVNVLLVHAAVRSGEDGGALPYFYGGGGALDVAREAGRWDAVCVGDFHQFTRLHPTALAFYSGSVERTSSNIWAETAPKGIVLYDTVSGEMEFVEHETRPMFDLTVAGVLYEDWDDVPPVTASQVNAALEAVEAQSACADALVRLRANDFPRDERADIDWRLVRELKSSCALFHLDLRLAARAAGDAADRRTTGRRSLAEELRDFAAAQGAAPGVVDCCLSFLAESAPDASDLQEVPA